VAKRRVQKMLTAEVAKLEGRNEEPS
jgi:hypothetical protein